MKNKYIFLGDLNSINSELISKSFNYLKNKVRYIVVGNYKNLLNDLKKIKNFPEINPIYDPLNFNNLNLNKINFFDISPKKEIIDNLLAQLQICNELCNKNGNELITMPINKFLFKKKITFNGMTEYFGSINNSPTLMLMTGENFSIIPITTHINIKNVGKNYEEKTLKFIDNLMEIDKKKSFLKFFNNIYLLCLNPHCSENGMIGKEDKVIKKYFLKYFKKNTIIQVAADSAFQNIKKRSLFISFYHDQALIPFKILNKKAFNLTIGLNYNRLSPSHGTASNIKFKNKADNTSFLQCMLN